MKKIFLIVVAAFVFFLFSNRLLHQEQKILNVAVASNFSSTFAKIQRSFEVQYDCKIHTSHGATSKLYLQIINNAPFDVFLAADHEHIKLLIDHGKGIKGTNYTYAVGQLVFYMPGCMICKKMDFKKLTSDLFKHIAIANPETAPYGKAAQNFLKKEGVWDELIGSSKIITAENVGQVMTFILTKNADAGFVAKSQVVEASINMNDVYELNDNCARLPQGGIVLNNKNPNSLAFQFIEFMKTKEVQKIILDSGYLEKTPDEEDAL